MRELATYIEESFFKNVGSDKAAIIAKGQDVAEDLEDFIKKNSDEIYRISDMYQHADKGSKAFTQARQEMYNMNAEIEKCFISKLPINGILFITTKNSLQKMKNGQAPEFVMSGPVYRKLAEGSDRQMSLAQISARINLKTNPSTYYFDTWGSFSMNTMVARCLLGFPKLTQDNKYCIAFYYDE